MFTPTSGDFVWGPTVQPWTSWTSWTDGQMAIGLAPEDLLLHVLALVGVVMNFDQTILPEVGMGLSPSI